METVHKSLVNWIMKLWIYQFYVLYHFSWPLLIHDLARQEFYIKCSVSWLESTVLLTMESCSDLDPTLDLD